MIETKNINATGNFFKEKKSELSYREPVDKFHTSLRLNLACVKLSLYRFYNISWN